MTNNGAPNKPVLLLTRPKAASQRLWSRLPMRLQDALRVIVSPIMEIVPHVMTEPVRGKAVIFTSAHGVAEAARQEVPRDLPAYVVGQTTAQAASAQGWHVVQTAPTAETLTQALIGEAPPTPLVHLHGTHTRGDIVGRLNRAGRPAESRILYDQRACALSEQARTALGGSIPVILPIFSPRSAALLSKEPKPIAPLFVIALSPSVAEAFHHTDICDLHVCAVPTRQAMDAALSDVAMALCRVEGSEGGQ